MRDGAATETSWPKRDQAVLWHPFTAMAEWCAPDHSPVVLERGEGVWLFDVEGKRYLDANSSIWTNIHGHAHPLINSAVEQQLKRMAHVSFLGTSHPAAIQLGEMLLMVAADPESGCPPLTRVFLSDDGSTAMECAIKMALQFHQMQGDSSRCEFLAFDGAYHGDTLGAATLGGIDAFHRRFSRFGVVTRRVSQIADLEQVEGSKIAALCIEPLIQGANRMRIWPPGMLRQLRQWCDQQGAFLIFDEVMTGFGRTGKMFACHHEHVLPDFLALGKGLSAGYSPLAATLTTSRVFEAFLPAENTFFYGNSFSGHALGCAAALANLSLFHQDFWSEQADKAKALHAELQQFLQISEMVQNQRQVGMIAAFDLVQPDGRPFPPTFGAGKRFCGLLREQGVLTRQILDSVVLMPPLSIKLGEITWLCQRVEAALQSFASMTASSTSESC